MSISTGVPASWKLPLFWATVDGSQAGGVTGGQPALIVGHPLALGIAMPNVPIACKSLANAKQLFGEGSMLERMVAKFLANNDTSEFWCMAIPQPTASVAATGSITLAVASLSSGVLSTYIAGYGCPITVYQTDTAATIANRLAAAINAMGILPVVAAVDGSNTGKVNLTAKWQGLSGIDIKLGLNQLGLYGGEATPVGLTATFVAMAGGAGTPDHTAAIAAIAAKQFYSVALPFSDTASLKAWDQEFGFKAGGRWYFTRQQYGWVFNAARFSYADAMVWGTAQNSAVISTAAIETTAPTPVWEFAAAYCAQAAAALLDDPAAPLHTLELVDCVPAPVESRFSQGELNDLSNNGFAIFGVAPSGIPTILAECLQYQENSLGQADSAFAYVTDLSNLAALLTRFKNAITTKFPRYKLAKDGTKFGAGQKILTPKIAKAEIVAEARKAEYAGLMQDVDTFIANLIVEIDPDNQNRLNVLWPPNLMGQLRQFAVLAQFRKSAGAVAA